MSEQMQIFPLEPFTWGELKKQLEDAGVKDEYKIQLIDIDEESEFKCTLSLAGNELFLTNFSNM
jgi:hypothetical protein